MQSAGLRHKRQACEGQQAGPATPHGQDLPRLADCPLLTLPSELEGACLSHLEHSDLCRLASTCSALRLATEVREAGPTLVL